MRLNVTIATPFTPVPQPAADLPESDRQPVAAGQSFEITQAPVAAGDYWQVTLAEPLAGRTVWYVLAAHVERVGDDAAVSSPAPSPTKGESGAKNKADDAAYNVGCGIVIAILGLLCLIIPITQLMAGSPEAAEGARLRWLGWAGWLGGVPLTAVGVWYGADAFTRQRQARREHLQRAFYAMVEAHDGEFSLLQYAKMADVSGQQARAYLDGRAQEFNATFEVDMNGGIIYRFR